MKIFSEKNIGKLIILNSSLVALLMWLGIVAHTVWDSKINLKMELLQMDEEYIKNKKINVRESVLDFIRSIDMRHKTTNAMLRRTLKEQVEQIHSIALHLYQQNVATMNKDTLEKMIIEAIRPITFSNGHNYFFIRSMSGITKLWPPAPEQEEKSIYNNSNENRLQVFNSMFATARNHDSGFNEYLWPKPEKDKNKLYQRIAYIKHFEPFDWYIGSGDYLVEALTEAGHRNCAKAIVRDDIYQIRATLSAWIADEAVETILVTGGTGFSGRDSTPEAVRPLFDKDIDGFGEVFRTLSLQEIGSSTIQSRAVAGFANNTVIFCMPGSTGACRTAWTGVICEQLDSSHRPCNFVGVLKVREQGD
jgi:molybdenum cofactor biosynthesis protein B